jgi:hypothetical protein
MVEAAGDLAELNVGGCIGITSSNMNCGKAYQNWFDCRFEACADCSDAGLSACLSAASGGACKGANDAVLTQCGANIGTYETSCSGTKYVFEGAIKAQCVAGVP